MFQRNQVYAAVKNCHTNIQLNTKSQGGGADLKFPGGGGWTMRDARMKHGVSTGLVWSGVLNATTAFYPDPIPKPFNQCAVAEILCRAS